MALTTSLPAVQDALKTAIDAQVTGGVPVSLGYPAGGAQKRHIWISGEPTAEIEYRVSGLVQRDEAVTVDVYCVASISTGSYAVARDAAVTLARFVEAAVAADHTLGGVGKLARVERVKFDEAIPGDTTRQVGVTVTVAVDTVVTA